MENNESKLNVADEIKEFYKGDFKGIVAPFFKNPIEGILSLFKNSSEKEFIHSLVLFGSVFIVYLLGSYILISNSFIEFSYRIKVSAIPVILMFLISVLSFGIKSMSGKSNFRNELLTGALCGIPIVLLLLVGIIVNLFGEESVLFDVMRGEFSFFLLIILYLFLMLTNVFHQSLKSSGTRDALSWYVSPAAIVLAIYLTYKVTENIFFIF